MDKIWQAILLGGFQCCFIQGSFLVWLKLSLYIKLKEKLGRLMNTKYMLRNGFIGLFGLLFSASLWAHGGAAGTDTDQCKMEIQGEWVHYTAYQPFISPGEEFCENLPELNTPTNLVFDYIGVKLRNMKVEFEITKEPEGKRVYFQKATQHKSGTINASVTFKEAGDYLVHVKLIPETGEAVDKHIGFSAGGGATTSMGKLALYALVFFAALYILYFSNAGFKQKVDVMLGKAKKW